MVHISVPISVLVVFPVFTIKYSLEKQLKEERVYSGSQFKDRVCHDEVKVQELETAGHITSTIRKERVMYVSVLLSTFYLFT